MVKAAEILEADKGTLGRVMTLEMGKPLRAAVAEAAKCATACRYYAENAERFLADEVVETGAKRELCPLPAARPGARGDAVEFSVLAGVPLRRAGADGGQRRSAEARVERAAVRARDRGHVSTRRLPRGRVSDAAHRFGAGATRLLERSTRRGRDAHRQRAGRHSGRGVGAAKRSRKRCSSSAAAILSS